MNEISFVVNEKKSPNSKANDWQGVALFALAMVHYLSVDFIRLKSACI